MGKFWVVVGDVDGIPVWEGETHSSPIKATKLSTGAVVEELRGEGERIFYVLREGEGPPFGWVFKKMDGGVLIVPKEEYEIWERGTFNGQYYKRTAPPWKKWYSQMEDCFKPQVGVGSTGITVIPGESAPRPYVWTQVGIEATKARKVAPGDDFTPAHLASMHSNRRKLKYKDLLDLGYIGMAQEYVWTNKGISAVSLSGNPAFSGLHEGDAFSPIHLVLARQWNPSTQYNDLLSGGMITTRDVEIEDGNGDD